MKVSKNSYFVLVGITLLLLGYVHGHTSIYRVSYSIEAKERELAKLTEEYKNVKFQVAKLHSPSVLSERVKVKALNLTLPKQHKVIRILKTNENNHFSMPWKDWHELPLLPQLGLVSEAQAKTPISSEASIQNRAEKEI